MIIDEKATQTDVGNYATIGAVLIPGIGPEVAAGISVLDQLFGLIKGKTQHATYGQVFPKADAWGIQVYNYVRKYITVEQFNGEWGYTRHCRDLFLQFMPRWWGSNQYPLRTSVEQVELYEPNANGYYRLLAMFYLWVWTNVDVNAGIDENGKIFTNLFNSIFVQGLWDSGLGNLKTTVEITTPGGTPGGGTTGGGKGVSLATLGTPILVVLALGAGLYMFTKR